MDSLTALTSVMSAAAFEANAHGHITVSNPPLVQLLRRVPGDDCGHTRAPRANCSATRARIAPWSTPTGTLSSSAPRYPNRSPSASTGAKHGSGCGRAR